MIFSEFAKLGHSLELANMSHYVHYGSANFHFARSVALQNVFSAGGTNIWGHRPPSGTGFFYYAIEKCAHSKRVRSTKIKYGPNFLLTLNCVCALYVPEIMRARHVHTSSIAQCVYARSAYGCLVLYTIFDVSVRPFVRPSVRPQKSHVLL